MARPEYIICLECESEVEDFTWRNGEIVRAYCEVCGNDDPDAFSLPEDMEDMDEEEEEDWEEDEEDYIDEDEEFEEEDE